MKLFLAVAALLVGACTAQQLPLQPQFNPQFQPQRYTAFQPNPNEIVITRSENENNGDGSFRWVSELSDGSTQEQSGYVKAGPDPESPIQVIQGAFSYISPEGQQINLQYIADENGFQPQGAHLPGLPQAARAFDGVYRNQNGTRYQQRYLEEQRLRLEEEQRRRFDDEERLRLNEEQRRYEEELKLYNQARALGQYRPRPNPPQNRFNQPRRV